MQRSLVWGAGIAVLVVGGGLALRASTSRQVAHSVDAGIAQLVARLPPGTAVRHGATEVNPLTGSLTLHDVVVTRDGVTLVTAGEITVSGADGQALQDVFDPARYPDGRPAWSDRRLLITDAAARDVHLTPPGFDVTERSFRLHRLSGRPFAMPPTPENRNRPQFLADAALALAVDSVEARDAVATTQGTMHATIRQGEFAISDYDAGRLGSLAYKNLTADYSVRRAKAFRLAMAGLDIKSTDFRPMLEEIRRTGRADRRQFGMLGYESADLTGLTFAMAGGPQFGLGAMHLSQVVAPSGETGKASVRGFTVDRGAMTPPPSAAPALAAFGKIALVADLEYDSHKSTVDRRFRAHEDIVLHDLGTLHVDAATSNYDQAVASPDHPFAAILGATLDRATIVYEDASLVGRSIAAAAAQAHVTPELIRAQLAMPLVALGLMMPEQPDAADQVAAFLNHPGTLTVTLDPPRHVTLAEVVAAPVPSRAAMLGAHVTAR